MTAPRPAPLWVTLEGANGVGKTRLAARLREQVDGAVVLDELPDAAPERLPGKVIAALAEGGDPFLRTGHPLTETLALLGLAVRRREEAPAAAVVIEDRGCDSVAVYQSLTLAERDGSDPYPIARRLLAMADRWRPRSDLTVLLTNDETTRRAQWAARLGRPLTRDEHHRAVAVAQLHARIAGEEPDRYLVLDIAELTTAQALSVLTGAVAALTSPAGAST
ncbi:thymidylate kinase [Streptomyces sp. H10-C2]|uniref:thymidylate kinase n=1 Tax=unclassified Streptomyces TaxID=2593676 RepID=UPI0024B93082|nr:MULTISPECIES: thymidylate kinase [unclassified Streptomyces]MDJ0342783.1 thymidylate kinase [Streptomyces sp. PH10-H1]MDJ0372461.1 thymidylate kinase [Streptomyces sp. H10-C2]